MARSSTTRAEEGIMPYAAPEESLARFQQHLLGTWSNEGVPLGIDNKP